jgi:hypothetical protein
MENRKHQQMNTIHTWVSAETIVKQHGMIVYNDSVAVAADESKEGETHAWSTRILK